MKEISTSVFKCNYKKLLFCGGENLILKTWNLFSVTVCILFLSLQAFMNLQENYNMLSCHLTTVIYIGHVYLQIKYHTNPNFYSLTFFSVPQEMMRTNLTCCLWFGSNNLCGISILYTHLQLKHNQDLVLLWKLYRRYYFVTTWHGTRSISLLNKR